MTLKPKNLFRENLCSKEVASFKIELTKGEKFFISDPVDLEKLNFLAITTNGKIVLNK
jgi:hypothetical protein